jgi:hypothetical protein
MNTLSRWTASTVAFSLLGGCAAVQPAPQNKPDRELIQCLLQLLRAGGIVIASAVSLAHAGNGAIPSVIERNLQYSAKVCDVGKDFLNLGEVAMKAKFGKVISDEVLLTKDQFIPEILNQVHKTEFDSETTVQWVQLGIGDPNSILILSVLIRSGLIDAGSGLRVNHPVSEVTRIFGKQPVSSSKTLDYGCDMFKFRVNVHDKHIVTVEWFGSIN